MIWFNIIIGLVTLLFVVLAYVLARYTYLKMVSMPSVIVRFWDGNKTSEEITLSPGDHELCFLFRNLGDESGYQKWKPAATMLTVFIYFPESFTIKEAIRYEAPAVKTEEVFQASPSGKFKGMKYIAVPSSYEVRPPAISILSYEEDVLCKVKINIPDTGKITEDIYIQMTSREGDLGVHELVINIKKESQ
ncbi:MAG: hypothetical protein SCARUB_01394 [Candidatus Scalindua rubra]|uniref:Uncharacterized protein n=1 Tax=Candidatus Scalindua rubra TaxID=1872076 RepID=A0A1E3XCY2_9BACT|nr:MAG: hypothetical protein SCARUB_01394 [Candidatus Scalindua rubra]